MFLTSRSVTEVVRSATAVVLTMKGAAVACFAVLTGHVAAAVQKELMGALMVAEALSVGEVAAATAAAFARLLLKGV